MFENLNDRFSRVEAQLKTSTTSISTLKLNVYKKLIRTAYLDNAVLDRINCDLKKLTDQEHDC